MKTDGKHLTNLINSSIFLKAAKNRLEQKYQAEITNLFKPKSIFFFFCMTRTKNNHYHLGCKNHDSQILFFLYFYFLTSHSLFFIIEKIKKITLKTK